MASIDDGVSELAAHVKGALLTDRDTMDAYRRDETHLTEPGWPRAVLLAQSVDDVSAALAWAQERRVPVVPRGAGTSLAGGAAALDGCLVVSTARMTKIVEVNVADQYAVVEAGVVNADLGRAVRGEGLMYPPDPSSFESSTIGGNLATNAGGLRCVKYGVTRDFALGLEVVLAGGDVLHTGGRTVKGVTGLDLTGLFVGSEGTLGIITRATMRLIPQPPSAPVTVVGSFPSLRSAAEAVAAVTAAGIGPSLMELIDHATLRAINEWKHMGLDDGTQAMLIAQSDSVDAADSAQRIRHEFEAAGADFVAVSDDPDESEQLLEVRRLAYPAAERLGRCLVEDVGVPRSRLPDMIEAVERAAERHGVTIFTVAHAGDGNLHPVFVFDPQPDGGVPQQVWDAADDVFRTALELGGTLTGEHGVGAVKQRWSPLELGPERLRAQRAIKHALDPHGILNPGRGV